MLGGLFIGKQTRQRVRSLEQRCGYLQGQVAWLKAKHDYLETQLAAIRYEGTLDAQDSQDRVKEPYSDGPGFATS